MEVSGLLHAPAALHLEKKGTLWIGGWVCPRAGLEKIPFFLFLELKTGRSVCPQVTVLTELSRIPKTITKEIN